MNETNVSELSENEAAAGEQREEIVHLEEENIPPENSPLADEPTLPMSPLPNIEDIPPSENGSGNNMRSRGSASTQTERDDRPPQAQGTGTGFIKVAVSTAQQAVPLPGCKVTISSGENGLLCRIRNGYFGQYARCVRPCAEPRPFADPRRQCQTVLQIQH